MTDYEMLSLIFTKRRRKAPRFIHGDISRLLTIFIELSSVL